ncbi:MAG: hypothetical protein BWY91_02709 [bacterium ADurb.BinA028]|nr:MAG: hypothetical protein BWY91_02709 [bacterium ADurb.BinA028]
MGVRLRRDIDRGAEIDVDGGVGAAHPLRVILGPHPLGSPDDTRDDRDTGVARHPRRTHLEVLELKRPRDGRLGIDPDNLTIAQRSDRPTVCRPARRAVDGNVLHPLHQRAGHRVLEDRLLGHEPDEPPARQHSIAGIGEVEIAGVVDRQHRSPVFGHVLRTGHGETQPLEGEEGLGDPDDGEVDVVHAPHCRWVGGIPAGMPPAHLTRGGPTWRALGSAGRRPTRPARPVGRCPPCRAPARTTAPTRRSGRVQRR